VTNNHCIISFVSAGPIRALDIKLPPGSSRGSAFAFIEFESSRDAGDAVDGRDGMDWGGGRLKVQRAKGGYVSSGSRGPPRRSGFRVRVTGLPEGSSWQVSNVEYI
jgi:arginine/serine-rich splicing factor 1/9